MAQEPRARATATVTLPQVSGQSASNSSAYRRGPRSYNRLAQLRYEGLPPRLRSRSAQVGSQYAVPLRPSSPSPRAQVGSQNATYFSASLRAQTARQYRPLPRLSPLLHPMPQRLDSSLLGIPRHNSLRADREWRLEQLRNWQRRESFAAGGQDPSIIQDMHLMPPPPPSYYASTLTSTSIPYPENFKKILVKINVSHPSEFRVGIICTKC